MYSWYRSGIVSLLIGLTLLGTTSGSESAKAVAVRQLFNLLLHPYTNGGKTPTCEDAMLAMFTDANSTSMTPFLMYTGKGINDMGDFDSCQKAGGMRFITLHIRNLPVVLAMGLCMPKECQPSDFDGLKDSIASVMTGIANGLKGNSSIDLTVQPDYVRFIDPIQAQEDEGTFGPGFWITMTVLSLFVLLCIVATMYLSERKDKEKKMPILECFDLYKNWNLLTVNPRKDEGDLSIFDGIRFLGVAWVILGHTFYYAADTPSINPDGVEKLTQEYSKAHIYNGTLSVDVFFFLSAFLLVYILMKKSKGQPQVSYQLYVHRVVRFYPGMLLSLCLFCFILPSLSIGPLYYRIYEKVNVYCGHVWYRILLFFDNFRPWGYTCIDWVWYVCLDFQLFIFTPFILVIYSKRRLVGILIPVIVIIINIIVTIILSCNYNIWASTSKYNHEFEDIYYEKPYTRAGPYMIGILAGLLYYEHKAGGGLAERIFNKIRDNMAIRGVLYVVGLFGAYLIMQTMYWMNKNIADLPRYADLLYLLFYRNIFIFCLFLLFLPVMAGKGRVLKMILGNQFFFVLGKLTYGAYMLHQIVMEYYEYIKQRPIFFGATHLYMQFWAYLSMAIIAAFLSYMFIEQPLFNLERLLLGPKQGERSTTKEDEEKAPLALRHDAPPKEIKAA